MHLRTLIAIGSLPLRRRVLSLLRGEEVTANAIDPARVWSVLNRGDVDLLVVDREVLPRRPTEWIRSVRGLPEQPEVVVLAAREDAAARAELLAAGCMAVLNVGLPDEAVRGTLATLLDRRRREGQRLWQQEHSRRVCSLQDFVSESPSMQRFIGVARRVVSSDSSLLLLGETGSGKERLARAIHAEGPRASGPFLAVNCGALPETLLESELFGHEQGAFTGATRVRRGYFELAHGGTIFLDEIAEMPLHLQVKLLRVIEDRRVLRLGGEEARRVDVRIMAATNRDLETEARTGRFRSDLYYRLAVVALSLPSLRERREDVPALVENYLQHFAATIGRPMPRMSPEAMAALVAHDWPGNVRELINVVERSVLLTTRPVIELADLPGSIARREEADPARRGSASLTTPGRWRGRTLAEARREAVDEFTRAYLGELLRETGGRVGETAARAGVDPRTLYDLMRRHGLRKEDFRPLSPGATG